MPPPIPPMPPPIPPIPPPIPANPCRDVGRPSRSSSSVYASWSTSPRSFVNLRSQPLDHPLQVRSRRQPPDLLALFRGRLARHGGCPIRRPGRDGMPSPALELAGPVCLPDWPPVPASCSVLRCTSPSPPARRADRRSPRSSHAGGRSVRAARAQPLDLLAVPFNFLLDPRCSFGSGRPPSWRLVRLV